MIDNVKPSDILQTSGNFIKLFIAANTLLHFILI